MAASLLLLLLSGCGDRWVPYVLDDQGVVCVSVPDEGDVGTVTVDPGLCLSSSCTEDLAGACEVAVAGNTLTVTSHFSWSANEGPVKDCTADCGSITASCDFDPVPPGQYTVVHGSNDFPVSIPGSEVCSVLQD